MKAIEANSVLALLAHLDGSHVTNASELIGDAELLHAAAGAAFRGGALPLDTEALAWTLDEVGQRFADAGWDERAVEDVGEL